MTVLDLEKDCPLCGDTGPAAGEDGEHLGVWKCKNNQCPKDMFCSSTMQFYNVETFNWTWSEIKERYT